MYIYRDDGQAEKKAGNWKYHQEECHINIGQKQKQNGIDQ